MYVTSYRMHILHHIENAKLYELFEGVKLNSALPENSPRSKLRVQADTYVAFSDLFFPPFFNQATIHS